MRRTRFAQVALCVAVLLAGLGLFVTDRGQHERADGVLQPIWAGYRAQIEYLQLNSALYSCVEIAACPVSDMQVRIGKLIDRLETLRAMGEPSSKVERLPAVVDIRQYGRRLMSYLTEMDANAFDPAKHAELRETIKPLGNVLQHLLAITAAASQAESRLASFSWQRGLLFAVLVLCCLGLLGTIAHELRSRRNLLMRAAKRSIAANHLQATAWGLLDTLPVSVLILTGEGTLAYANPAASRLSLALRPTRSSSTPLADVIHRSFGSLPAGTSLHELSVAEGDGGRRELSVAARPIQYRGEQAALYVAFDNAMLPPAEVGALTTARLAVLGELSAAIVHELNQPLAVIKAAVANGRTQASSQPNTTPIIAKLNRIDEQVERASRIIASIRRLGGATPAGGTSHRFDVAHSIDAVVALVADRYNLSGITLEKDLRAAIDVIVEGDAALFEIAVLNILTNACDAFTPGCPIDLDRTVRLTARAAGANVEIVISDNAGGVPEHLLPRIFDPFVSSKGSDRGTGLGLAIARRAVNNMQGVIAAQNDSDGAVFTIRLPALLQEIAA